MAKCRTAVPVWIMPLSRLVENFDFRDTQFDVLVIDEASQCDVTALLALMIAKKVIVVGDHEQVSPSAVGQKLDIVRNLISMHLEGIPNKHLYDGQTSIYDLAQMSFRGMTCLLEHFRCMPDIIRFSNYLSYNGDIKPLRDASTTHLRPHVIPYRVEGSSRNGKINAVEAETVASLVVALTEHAAYEKHTMGAVSLVGDEQALEIERLLLRHLPPEEFESRRILCGNPAQFQGDERDVMFLSVVDAPTGEGQLRMKQEDRFKQRFNVAASRARDQMWVVTSLSPDDLGPGDLRRRLIEHALDPGALERDLEATQKRAESEFERQVIKRLMVAGYRVIPQWEVGRFRIDIVVEGGGKTLAVECDGDRYHPIEKLPEDMARQAILERLGWRFVRLRGSQFFRDPDGTMESVFRKLEELEIPPEGTDRSADEECLQSNEVIDWIIARAAQLRAEWAANEELGEVERDGFSSEQVEPHEAPAETPTRGTGSTVEDPKPLNHPSLFPELPSGSDEDQLVPEKEAWQMRKVEWKQRVERARHEGDESRLRVIGGMGTDAAHRFRVQQALSEGKPVPPEVLEDYPDLGRLD